MICPASPNAGPPQRTRVDAAGNTVVARLMQPVTQQDVANFMCWAVRQKLLATLPLKLGDSIPEADAVAYLRPLIEQRMESGLSFEDAIPDGFWFWIFFEDLYALAGRQQSVSVISTSFDRYSLPGQEAFADAFLASTGVAPLPANIDALESAAGQISVLVDRAFFPAERGPHVSRSGASYATWGDFVRAELPESYWRPAVGFFDDLLGGISTVGGYIADAGAAAISLATENPAATAQLLAQLGLIDPLGNGSVQPNILLGNGGINPDTGSINPMAASGLAAAIQQLQQGGSGAGGTPVAGGMMAAPCPPMRGGTVVYQLPACTRPPRRVVYQRPDGSQFEFTSRGRPLLYSGDVSAVKRVSKAASRARRSRPRRRALPAIDAGVRVVCGKCMSSPCGC